MLAALYVRARPDEALDELRGVHDLLIVAGHEKVLVDHTRADVAVAVALDDDLVALVAVVVPGIDLHTVRLEQRLKRLRRGARAVGITEIDLGAAQAGMQRLGVDQARETIDHRLGEQVRLRELGERFALDRRSALARVERRADERLPQHELIALVVVLEVPLFSADLDL